MRPWIVFAVVFVAFPALSIADSPAPPAIASARVDAAAQVFAAVEVEFAMGRVPLDTAYLWSVRWYESQRAAGVKSAAADHLRRMQSLRAKVKSMVQAGVASRSSALATTYYAIEAEAWAATP